MPVQILPSPQFNSSTRGYSTQFQGHHTQEGTQPLTSTEEPAIPNAGLEGYVTAKLHEHIQVKTFSIYLSKGAQTPTPSMVSDSPNSQSDWSIYMFLYFYTIFLQMKFYNNRVPNQRLNPNSRRCPMRHPKGPTATGTRNAIIQLHTCHFALYPVICVSLFLCCCHFAGFHYPRKCFVSVHMFFFPGGI